MMGCYHHGRRTHQARIDQGVYESLKLETGLKRREISGGTGPNAVATAIAAARSRLG